MHKAATLAATAPTTLDLRLTKAHRPTRPNEDGYRPSGTVIPYPQNFSAFYHARAGILSELETENAELRDHWSISLLRSWS